VSDISPEAFKLDVQLQITHQSLERALTGYNLCLEKGSFWALSNTSELLKESFRLGVLHWRSGNAVEAKEAFKGCLEAQWLRNSLLTRFPDNAANRAEIDEVNFYDGALLGLSTFFLEAPVAVPVRLSSAELPTPKQLPFYWLDNISMGVCSFCEEPDTESFNAALTAMGRPRGSVLLAETFEFYMDVLCGKWAGQPVEAMFEKHAKLWKARGRLSAIGDDMRNGGGVLGQRFAVDYRFAAVLKWIGWEGVALHSWPPSPEQAGAGENVITTRMPDRFIGAKRDAAPLRQPERKAEGAVAHAGAMVMERLAVLAQKPHPLWGPIVRTEQERVQVRDELRKLGIDQDTETCAIMETYRIGALQSPEAHFGPLSDPIGNNNDLRGSTKLFRADHGCSSDFIVLTAMEEMSEMDEPEDEYLVYWISDQRVYLAAVKDWSDPAKVAEASTHIPGRQWQSFAAFLSDYLSVD
jgi:hypothetical protein